MSNIFALRESNLQHLSVLKLTDSTCLAPLKLGKLFWGVGRWVDGIVCHVEPDTHFSFVLQTYLLQIYYANWLIAYVGIGFPGLILKYFKAQFVL